MTHMPHRICRIRRGWCEDICWMKRCCSRAVKLNLATARWAGRWGQNVSRDTRLTANAEAEASLGSSPSNSLLPAQEHTFPAHVWGSSGNLSKTSGFGAAFVWTCKEVVLMEAVETGVDAASPLTAGSPTAAVNYGRWLFHFNSCLCGNTRCVALPRQFECFHSFYKKASVMCLNYSWYRFLPSEIPLWLLTALLSERYRSESSCLVRREQSFWVDIYCNFSEKREWDWKCCEDEPLHPVRRRRSQERTLPSCTVWI